MARDPDGPIVIDPFAFERLRKALAVWLFLFLTAGDGTQLIGRGLALAFGESVKVIVTERGRSRGRNVVHLRPLSLKSQKPSVAPVGKGGRSIKIGSIRSARRLWGKAFLEDDLGYTRWKGGLFAAAFVALWIWALAIRRFG